MSCGDLLAGACTSTDTVLQHKLPLTPDALGGVVGGVGVNLLHLDAALDAGAAAFYQIAHEAGRAEGGVGAGAAVEEVVPACFEADGGGEAEKTVGLHRCAVETAIDRAGCILIDFKAFLALSSF